MNDEEFKKLMKRYFIKYKSFHDLDFEKLWEDWNYKNSPIMQDVRQIVELALIEAVADED